MNRFARTKEGARDQVGGKLKLKRKTLASLRGSGVGRLPLEGRPGIGDSFTGTSSIITARRENLAHQYTDGGKLSNGVSCIFTCA